MACAGALEVSNPHPARITAAVGRTGFLAGGGKTNQWLAARGPAKNRPLRTPLRRDHGARRPAEPAWATALTHWEGGGQTVNDGSRPPGWSTAPAPPSSQHAAVSAGQAEYRQPTGQSALGALLPPRLASGTQSPTTRHPDAPKPAVVTPPRSARPAGHWPGGTPLPGAGTPRASHAAHATSRERSA
eukprot:COSAG01_NODE_1867_length_9028_cov_5.343673_7_plen_187_part_00